MAGYPIEEDQKSFSKKDKLNQSEMAGYPIEKDQDSGYLSVAGPNMTEDKEVGERNLHLTDIKLKELSDQIRYMKEALHDYEEKCQDYCEQIKDYNAEKMSLIRENCNIRQETKMWKNIASKKSIDLRELKLQIKHFAEVEKVLREQIKKSEATPNNGEYERQKREVSESKLEIDKLKQQVANLEKAMAEKDERISKTTEGEIQTMRKDMDSMKKGQDKLILKLNENDNTQKEMLSVLKEKEKTNKELLNAIKENEKKQDMMFDVIKDLKDNIEFQRDTTGVKTPRFEALPSGNKAVRVEKMDSFVRRSEHTTYRNSEINAITKTTEQRRPTLERKSDFFPDVSIPGQTVRSSTSVPWKQYFYNQGKR